MRDCRLLGKMQYGRKLFSKRSTVSEFSAKKAVTYRLPVDILDRIADQANARDIPLTDLIEEALREKFERIDTGKDGGWGPLAGLPDVDKARAIKFVECLRAAPKARGFRRAVDANFAWLMESVATK
jgi:hypothetical protein